MAEIAPSCHGYLLHSRPYREKSRLTEWWTLEHGRISAVMRQNPPPLFQPCLMAWRGKKPLKTLQNHESVGLPYILEGNAMFAGFYLNELLVRLLAYEEAHTELFVLYSQTLESLKDKPNDIEPALRHFERCLLTSLGYALDFRYDAQQRAIQPDDYYAYQPQQGFIKTDNLEQMTWRGSILLAIAAEDWRLNTTKQAAKKIIRAALAVHLGNKPLKSRELFI
ncbi:MAG TPA: DNA repair protein RecO [Agitococcus sp.]|nr:DNA repair protein RecO [Agitococcus sp.]